jgi:hypothetical protein
MFVKSRHVHAPNQVMRLRWARFRCYQRDRGRHIPARADRDRAVAVERMPSVEPTAILRPPTRCARGSKGVLTDGSVVTMCTIAWPV